MRRSVLAFKQVKMPFGRTLDYKPPHPDRTARKSLPGHFGEVVFQTWPSRAAMARSIRMQQSRAPKSDDWKAVVKLTDIEGYY